MVWKPAPAYAQKTDAQKLLRAYTQGTALGACLRSCLRCMLKNLLRACYSGTCSSCSGRSFRSCSRRILRELIELLRRHESTKHLFYICIYSFAILTLIYKTRTALESQKHTLNTLKKFYYIEWLGLWNLRFCGIGRMSLMDGPTNARIRGRPAPKLA